MEHLRVELFTKILEKELQFYHNNLPCLIFQAVCVLLILCTFFHMREMDI